MLLLLRSYFSVDNKYMYIILIYLKLICLKFYCLYYKIFINNYDM